MKEELISTGIDIGTTTLQVIFSKLSIQNSEGYGRVPRMQILSKKILYESEAFFTPFKNLQTIDSKRVRDIILEAYAAANIHPSQVSCGAVIITGETSRKRNAQAILHSMADIAGHFVVAVAGPDLESVLAGKGSGASLLSRQKNARVMNLDIGGGTTNIALFEHGKTIDTACYDIGARLIRVENGMIGYIAPKLRKLLRLHSFELSPGEKMTMQTAETLCGWLTELLEQAAGLIPETPELQLMLTNHSLGKSRACDFFTFSGGVAKCMNQLEQDDFAYGDLGFVLARKLMQSKFASSGKMIPALETLRATVIGAGNHSLEISGSTIEYLEYPFPQKNLPVIHVPLESAEDIPQLFSSLSRGTERFFRDADLTANFAISMQGIHCPTFYQIEAIAAVLAQSIKKIPGDRPITIILENDQAKALGQALKRCMNIKRPFLCMDGIHCDTGDFVDIGAPIAKGAAVPVVVKTLLFSEPD